MTFRSRQRAPALSRNRVLIRRPRTAPCPKSTESSSPLEIHTRVNRKSSGSRNVVPLIRSGCTVAGDFSEVDGIDVGHRIGPVRSVQEVDRIDSELKLLTFGYGYPL